MAKSTNKEAPPESEELVKGILEWLALAHGHSEDADELLQQVLKLREAAIGPSPHVKLLDLLFGHAESVLQAELPSLQPPALPVSRKTRQKIKPLLTLLEMLAQEYFNSLAAHYNPQDHLSDERMQASLRRAAQAIATQIHIHHLIAAPPGNGLWQQLNAAYRTARRLGIEQRSGTAGNTSIERLYTDTLLQAIAQPASFSSGELLLISSLTERLGHLVKLAEAPPDAPGDDVFWIDLERDSPAYALVRRQPGEGIRPLYFAGGELAAGVRNIASTLAAGTTAESLGLPEIAGEPAGRGVMRRLEKLWGAPARRRFPRRRHAYRARLCLGLEGLHRLLQGEEGGDDVSEWMVTNESPEGYALMHMSGSTARLRVGDIVAIQPREEFSPRVDNWHVCIVRWAISENPEHIEIGLQVLATRALSARIADPSRSGLAPLTALLLPEAPPVRPAQSLITPAGSLAENRRRMVLLIEQDNLQIREVQTGALSEQTGIVEIFTLLPDSED